MAKNFNKSLGSLSDNLHDVMAAIVHTNDLAATNQIKKFKQIVHLYLMAKEAGVPEDFFLNLISAFRVERVSLSTGEVEMAGAASTGFETQEGQALHVDLNVGGSIAGFGVGLEGGYQQSSSNAKFERSTQNFRILARWATGPGDISDELMANLTAFVAKVTPGANIPALPEEFESPTLEMLRDMLPLLAEVLGDDDEPTDDEE